MTKHRVAILDRFHHEALQSLKSNGEFEVVEAASASDADALIIRTKTKVDAAFLKLHPKVRAIVTATVGFDHIDLEACAKAQVKVAHCPDSHTQATAELTWALVLACARRTLESDRAVRAGLWDRDQLVGTELGGHTYGIAGLGRIGSRVAKIAQAFGMNVVAFDPYRDDDYFAARDVSRVGLDELFHLSQVISLHVPNTRETRGMVHRYRLDLLKHGHILVNTSRGGVIVESDLIDYFRAGGLARIGLDVFESEPLSRESGLLTHPHILLSPHLGANTAKAFRAVSFEAAANLSRLLKNEAPTGPLPPPEDGYQAIRP